jgi:radical SAM superfamily enzyme YgiQ (UPF0313 family)
MELLKNTYGSKGIYFVGDNFTFNKKKTLELCSLIKERHLDMIWACETGVDMVSRELLTEMKSAGCETMFFGVESGGLKTVGSFIIGIPGETLNDMNATFKFAQKLDPDWHLFNIFIPYPGCRLYDEIIAKKQYDYIEDFLAYVKTDEFDYQKLVEIHKRFHRNFNRTPKRVLRKIREEGIISVSKKALHAL